SALFDKKVRQAGAATTDPRYRNALFHLMLAQTSCFRYWGQGTWTDYGREFCRRAIDILNREF
ncbi:MAG: glycosyl hydrolase family 57, partial [Planctomycetota bacterium]|nr:glycosyl hydrolase family 57 [Planctomycetota bacterium]